MCTEMHTHESNKRRKKLNTFNGSLMDSRDVFARTSGAKPIKPNAENEINACLSKNITWWHWPCYEQVLFLHMLDIMYIVCMWRMRSLMEKITALIWSTFSSGLSIKKSQLSWFRLLTHCSHNKNNNNNNDNSSRSVAGCFASMNWLSNENESNYGFKWLIVSIW